MQIIKFPGLGIEIPVSKIAIQIGKISIHWYAIFIVLAFCVGLYLCSRKNGQYGIKFENVLELFLILVPIALICARLYYCIFKIDLYIKNPVQILNIKSGGLAIYGGIIGGAITSFIYCKVKNINFLDLLDYIVPYLALGQAIGRWGNFFNIEAYGTKTSSFLRMRIIENGAYVEVHPTFFYESLVTFLIFVFLIKQQKTRKFSGEIAYTYLIGYSFARFFIEGKRSDSLMLFNLKISKILSLVIFVVFCFILIYKKVKYKKIKVSDKKWNKKGYET